MCYTADIEVCATANCCNLILCEKCFFHEDHTCGPCGPSNRPVPRCLLRCQYRYDSGWGDRCWSDCKRAVGHRDICVCLQDHRGRPGWDQIPLALEVPPVPIGAYIINGSYVARKKTKAMQKLIPCIQRHKWRPSCNCSSDIQQHTTSVASSSTSRINN